MRVYVAESPAARIVVPLENLFAIFHVPAGATHILASPAPEILDALADGPADGDALLDRLARRHELDMNGAREAIAARLDELEAGGLVSRA